MSTKAKLTKETYIFGGIWLLFMVLTFIAFITFQSYNCVDYDSSYQYFLVQHGWKDMHGLLLKDYSPPLYTYVLKAYSLVFGSSLNALRGSNLILTGYLFFLSLFPLRKLAGAKCSLIGSVLLLCSQFNCYFGHLIRPTYAGYVLTTAVFIYAALSFFDKEGKYVITLAVVSLLSMYTHNVSLISAFCVYGILCILTLISKDKKKFLRYLISGGIIGVLYLPWLAVTTSQLGAVNKDFWSLRMGVGETVDFVYSYPFFNRSNDIVNLVIALFVMASCIAGIVVIVDRKKLRKAQTLKDLGGILKDEESKDILKKSCFIALMQIVSLAAFFIFSHKLGTQSPRYFYVLTGGALIFMGGFMSLADKKHIVTIIALIVMPINMVTNYLFFDKNANESEVDRLYSDISAAATNSDKLYFYHGDESSLGTDSYLFDQGVHMVDINTYTVLQTYDVFTTDVRYIEGGNFFAETDEIFVVTFSPFFFPMDPSGYEYEEIGVYKLPYVGTETGYIDVHAYRVTPA